MDPLVTAALQEHGLAHFQLPLAAAGHSTIDQLRALNEAQLDAVGFEKATFLRTWCSG
jgi:hypothetical protein